MTCLDIFVFYDKYYKHELRFYAKNSTTTEKEPTVCLQNITP